MIIENSKYIGNKQNKNDVIKEYEGYDNKSHKATKINTSNATYKYGFNT